MFEAVMIKTIEGYQSINMLKTLNFHKKVKCKVVVTRMSSCILYIIL